MTSARGFDSLPAYRQDRIRRVVLYLAQHGPSASGYSTPFDDGDLGDAQSAGFIRRQAGTLRRELTDKGRELASQLRSAGATENPLSPTGVHVAIGLGVLAGVAAFGYVLAKGIGSGVAQAAGGAVLVNQTPATVALSPKDRKSVQLSPTAASNYALPTTLDVAIAPTAAIDITPATGVVDFERTTTGVRIVARAPGAALLTVSYPPDTTGANDAIVSVGVV